MAERWLPPGGPGVPAVPPGEPGGLPVELLSAEEARWLLALGSKGHLAVTEGALPAVVPAIYRVDEGVLTVWAGPGLSSPRMLSAEVVALQVEAQARDGTWAWSVLVRGRAFPLPPGDGWLPLCNGAGPCWRPSFAVRLEMELVSGWMIGEADVRDELGGDET